MTPATPPVVYLETWDEPDGMSEHFILWVLTPQRCAAPRRNAVIGGRQNALSIINTDAEVIR